MTRRPKLARKATDDRDPRLLDVAARVARELFTNGAGQHADRLQLKGRGDGATETDLGGWSERAVADVVYDVLAGEGGR